MNYTVFIYVEIAIIEGQKKNSNIIIIKNGSVYYSV